jgi:tetratricopeptide (TPR) repeat protein
VVGVWDAARKQQIHSALDATGKPYAEDAWRGVERALDDFSARWIAMRTDACEATRLRGEQSEELLDLRIACLDGRLRDLRALTDLYTRADGDVAVTAAQSAARLGSLAACGNAEALRARGRPPPPLAQRDEVERLEGGLAAARVLERAAKYSEGLAAARAVAAAADQLGYGPLIADALHTVALLEHDRGDNQAAAESAHRAALAAERAEDDRAAVRAWTLLAWVDAALGRTDDEDIWAGYAQAALDRAGGDDDLEEELLYTLGANAVTQGRVDEGLEQLQRSDVLLARLAAPDDPRLPRNWNAVAVGLQHQARLDEALDYYRRARDALVRLLGPRHPDTIYPASNIAVVMWLQGRSADALPPLVEAQALADGAVGPDAPQAAFVRLDRALVERELRRSADALADASRARAAMEKAFGPDNPSRAFAWTVEGEALTDLGRADEALAPLERALAARQAHPGDPKELAETRWALARALQSAGRDAARAHRLAAQARESFAAAPQAPLHRARLRDLDGR